jgi:serine/threonine protein kinase
LNVQIQNCLFWLGLKFLPETRFPAYSAPEVVEGADAHLEVSFPADIWSLSASLFHLVSGQLPFDGSTKAMTRRIRNADEKAADVREKLPAHVRDKISSEFAAILSKGLQKVPAQRFSSAADMATALHHCLVQQGQDVFSIFISYYEPSKRDKLCAVLLHCLLDKTRTKKGCVVRVCMRPSLLVHGQHWTGQNLGLLNSLVALPILSTEVLENLKKLKGTEDDQCSNFLDEIVLMLSLQQNSIGRLKNIFPVAIDMTSSDIEQHLVPRTSPPTSKAVMNFLKQSSIELPDSNYIHKSVRESMAEVLKIQGAKLWNQNPGKEKVMCEELGEELKPFMAPQGPFTQMEIEDLMLKIKSIVGDIHSVLDNVRFTKT